MFEIAFEEDTGILRVMVLGEWTRSEVDRYRDAIHQAVPEARRRHGALRMLVDSRRGKTVPRALLKPLMQIGDGLMAPEDRVAGLVESSVRKLELRSVVAEWQLFLSEPAARTWLSAMDHELAEAS
jgi:hypothetical protein